MNIIGGILAYLLIGWFASIVVNGFLCYHISTTDYRAYVDLVSIGTILFIWPIAVPLLIGFFLCFYAGKISIFLTLALRDKLIELFPLKDKRNP